MKKAFLCAALLLAGALLLRSQGDLMVLRYASPASVFEEAMPLGNGHLGAMVYGRVGDELIRLNEATLWSGTGADTDPIDGRALLAEVRQALLQEDWARGQELAKGLQGRDGHSFLPLGELHLRQSFGAEENRSQYAAYDGARAAAPLKAASEVSRYSRTLDMERAVATTTFTVDGVDFSRECFVSHPQRVLVLRLTASQKGRLEFTLDGSTPWDGCSVRSLGPDAFAVSGQVGGAQKASWKEPFSSQRLSPEGERGMRYQYRVKVLSCDGQVYSTPGLHVSGASEAVILVSAATSFAGFDRRPDSQGRDEAALAASFLDAASRMDYPQLLAAHTADFSSLFNRVSLQIGPAVSDTSWTDERLAAYDPLKGDPVVEMQYFQFGRYLLISASREDSEVPCNLQGIWNKDRHPAWGSDLHTNINVQMNYWSSETLALSEMGLPYLAYIGHWAANGERTVCDFYGMNGWTVHHSSDIWARTNPYGNKTGNPSWANWAMGGGWLCQALYDHYLFTQDEAWLRDVAYPLMKGAADFLMDWLIEKDGEYITAPSTSPENAFIDDNGRRGSVTIGSAMDLEICWDLFDNLIAASRLLGTDPGLRSRWTHYRDHLHPLQIGSKGNLMEWYKDWEDTEKQHRHVSHLYGLYPGHQISPVKTPELAAAARRTLEMRGDGGTGWSKAWKICFWARLLDGDHAYKMYRELLHKSTLPNYFDTHPPFQIDGNFGAVAGVGEMLLQSQDGTIHLLPALPAAWSEGAVSGLRARGGYSVDIAWSDGSLREASLTCLAPSERTCTVLTDVPVRVQGAHSRSRREGDLWRTTFHTRPGATCKIIPTQ